MTSLLLMLSLQDVVKATPLVVLLLKLKYKRSRCSAKSVSLSVIHSLIHSLPDTPWREKSHKVRRSEYSLIGCVTAC